MTNKWLWVSLWLAVSAMAPSLASAQEPVQIETGNDLLHFCETEEPLDGIYCIGFITGVEQSLEAIPLLDQTARTYCRPANSTNGQIIDSVVQSLRLHPTVRHMEAGALTIAALRSLFPCSQP